MTESELKNLYDWMEIGPEDEITVELIERKTTGGYRGFRHNGDLFLCTPDGASAIEGSKNQMAWDDVAEAFKEIQAAKREGGEKRNERTYNSKL